MLGKEAFSNREWYDFDAVAGEFFEADEDLAVFQGTAFVGAAVEVGRWHAVAAVKQGGQLPLYLDGRAVGSGSAPEVSRTQTQASALGKHPHYGGNEFLAARFADFR